MRRSVSLGWFLVSSARTRSENKDLHIHAKILLASEDSAEGGDVDLCGVRAETRIVCNGIFTPFRPSLPLRRPSPPLLILLCSFTLYTGESPDVSTNTSYLASRTTERARGKS